MARTGTAVLDWCQAQVSQPSRDWFTYCLIFARSAFGVAAQYPDAATAWSQAAFKHGTAGTPPAAVPVWWTGGTHGYGHVAVSAGNGYCYSTDILRHGKVDKVPITRINLSWGLTYKGWTEDINSVRVYTLPPPFSSMPAVDLSNVQDALRRDYPLPQNAESSQPDVLRVERALQAVGLLPNVKPTPGFTGILWRQAYAKWQRDCGVGGPFDGILGIQSLTLLGERNNFRVVP